MAATLRVDPARLRAAAAAEAQVGDSVSRMGVGRSLFDAADGMPGLLSGAACQFAGAIFDAAAGRVRDELSTHSGKLSTAADHYHRADDELGRRLRRLAE